jgi:hypothetical protein
VGATTGGSDRTFGHPGVSPGSPNGIIDKYTHPTFYILLSTPETMFKQSIKDTAEAK